MAGVEADTRGGCGPVIPVPGNEGPGEMTYSPRPHIAEILIYALAIIEGLPYIPSSCYVFYRFDQEAIEKGHEKEATVNEMVAGLGDTLDEIRERVQEALGGG